MLHHVSVGTSDMARSTAFYDAALKPLGMKRMVEYGEFAVGYGSRDGPRKGRPEIWVQIPHDGQAMSVGNGIHICFTAPSRDAIHEFHTAGIEAGGSDDGAPGPRPQYAEGYYGAFLRDPDGNKIEAVRYGE